jgi:hypothetical protein
MIPDQGWRVRARPMPIANDNDPERQASLARRRSWDRAFYIFGAVSLLYFAGELLRAWL